MRPDADSPEHEAERDDARVHPALFLRTMNVLYVGNVQGLRNAGKTHLIPQRLLHGFARAGHNVYLFNDREVARCSTVFGSRKFGIVPMNRKLLALCRAFEPELIVLGHCEMVWNRTLERIRAACPGVRIVYRNVDPLIYAQNVKDIERRVGAVDGIFLTTAGEPLRRFARAGSFVCFMPNPVDPAVDVMRSFATENPRFDLFFASGPLGRDDARHSFLEELQVRRPKLHYAIHGAGINRDFLWGKAYLARLAASRTGLCLNRTHDYPYYSSDRLAQYLGNGLMTFLKRGVGYEEIFEDGEIAFYHDLDELEEKLDYFLAHDEKRRAGAERAWRKAHEYFDCRKVAQYIVETSFGQAFSEDYRWPTRVYR